METTEKVLACYDIIAELQESIAAKLPRNMILDITRLQVIAVYTAMLEGKTIEEARNEVKALFQRSVGWTTPDDVENL